MGEVRNILRDAPDNLIGVMIGRAALGNPCILGDIDRSIYGEAKNPATARTRHSILAAYCEYLEQEHPAGGAAATSSGSGPTQAALKPVQGIFNGVRGNKMWSQGVHDLCHDKQL